MNAPETMLTNIEDAIEYRDNLDADGNQYLKAVDQFTAKLKPGVTVDLTKEVKPSNMEKFYRAFSYILLATNLDISFSSDFTMILRNN